MEAKQQLEEIMEVASDICNEWECNFLESVQEQLQNGRELSSKQLDTLERIYQKACNSPY